MNRHWSIRAYYFQGEDAREALRDALLGAGEPELRSALLDVYDQIRLIRGICGGGLRRVNTSHGSGSCVSPLPGCS